MTVQDSNREGLGSALEGLFERARSLASEPEKDVHVVELLSVYVSIEKQNGMAWFFLGDSLRSIGRFAEGESALSNAIGLAPDTARFTVYARLGMLAGKRSAPLDAEKWYRLATAQAGCPGWIWCLRGANLIRVEAHGLAKTCLEAALKSEDVVREEALLNLALIARAQRRYSEAKSLIEEALLIDSNYEDALAVLASLSDINATIETAAFVAAASPAGPRNS